MQRVLVTGANRGLGLEFTRQLLARGAHVFATCRHPGKALRLTELAGAHPGRLNVLPLDLTSEHSISALAREVAALTHVLDVLINNGGVLVSGERFGELAAKSFSNSFATNALGPLLLSQALTSLLIEATDAKIINLSSEVGSIADTTTFYTPSYALSKAALNMTTRLLAATLRTQRIIVVSMNPGWVKTDMGGASAPVTPQASVEGMLQVIDKLHIADTGRFLDYQGAEVAW